ncbi:acyl-CoA thioesterase [Hoyosella altamirensis]|uniref:Acyl-CoA thioester hydrolase n=1 Tax=Hoyosella altamirensis TaxID=616997 RepID=A0A839RSL6_9ACTN|nr:acyl-CoA thioesterase [Hoyosella altamirensis]MBB3039126.1 acyl-CoA thioester hydrolase [Hoyosella altamirensis]
MSDTYKCQVEVRWGDSDMLGHVNNTKFIEYAQEARVRFIAENFGHAFTAGKAVVVRHLEADFERPLFTESGPLTVELEVLTIGTSSFTIRHLVFDNAGNRAGALTAVLVAFSTTSNSSRPLEPAEREGLEAYLVTDE